ncbi:MAG: ArsA family ATPase, partial [Frankiales bacterium]|nr:ArsA family ATPase [Frankiales bacterium]
LELRTQVASGRWDLVVVDCAPTGETLRLLALPAALAWYVEKVFPQQRRVLRATRPLLRGRTAVPLPADGVFEAVERLHGQLAEVRALLGAPTTSVRLVLTPEAVVVAEARRTLTALALYGYRVDEVVANRVFPASQDAFLHGWVQAQQAQLEAVRRDLGGLRLRTQPYRDCEPVGLAELTALGEGLYGGDDPGLLPPEAGELLTVERDGDGFVLGLPLPLARREDLDLARSGDELVLTVGGNRRLVTLPGALTRCEVAGAALEQGRLLVRFRPDPARWPEALRSSW